MNHLVNAIASSVLPKEIKDYSTSELEQLAHQYPYAGALQLLLAQKLKSDHPEKFAGQLEKALLYFNNPLFVQYVVNAEDKHTAETSLQQRNATNLIENEPVSENPPLKVDAEMLQSQEVEDEQPAVPIPAFKIEPVDPETAVLSFTPYYTIDYFASQGIKLSENAQNTTDRFGSQLKTFTSWLKQMRRLPESEIVSKFSQKEKTSIEQMAENSLTGENAVTEAMAEVWIKQGEKSKAIDIYKKLSLQNPSKNAFFVSKIDHLKKQK